MFVPRTLLIYPSSSLPRFKISGTLIDIEIVVSAIIPPTSATVWPGCIKLLLTKLHQASLDQVVGYVSGWAVCTMVELNRLQRDMELAVQVLGSVTMVISQPYKNNTPTSRLVTCEAHRRCLYMHTSRFRQALHTAVYLERFLRSGREQEQRSSSKKHRPSHAVLPSFNHLETRKQQWLQVHEVKHTLSVSHQL